MAGDWIKMTVDLHEKPEVVRLASALDRNRFDIVGRLHRFWSWFDRQSRDGHVVGVTDSFLDEIVSCDGFANAMRAVFWLDSDEQGVYLPNFDAHNGKSAKSRATAADRKRRSRAKRDDGHAESVTKTGPEKRREEKSSTSLSLGREGEETGHGDSVTSVTDLREESESTLRAGFPEKQVVLDYCESKGWPVQTGSEFWLHFDEQRSNGDRPISDNWHWWSRLERWVIEDARRNAVQSGGNRGQRSVSKAGKSDITNYESADEWSEDQNTLGGVSQ